MATYLPTDLINQDFTYKIYDNYYQVFKDCNNQSQCTCQNVYFQNDYLVSNDYSCHLYSNDNVLNSTSFTDNFFYRLDITQSMIIFCILFYFNIYLVFKIFSRFFGRWLKI